MGISVAHELWKGLSLGANFSYVGGSISQTETQGSATESNSSHKHTIYADFGLQYTYKLDHYRSVVAGVVYGYSQDLMQDNDHAVSSSSSSGKRKKVSHLFAAVYRLRSVLYYVALDGFHRL